MRTRIELTFSSGKFIAFPNVITSSIHYNKGDLCFLVDHPEYGTDKVIVKMDKIDFVEYFEDKRDKTE